MAEEQIPSTPAEPATAAPAPAPAPTDPAPAPAPADPAPADPAPADPAPADPAPADPGEKVTIEDLKIPEGFDIPAEDFGALAQIFDEAGVPFSKEIAQKLVDTEVSRFQRFQEAEEADFKKTVAGWREAVETDKELGGENLDRTLIAAQEAFNAVATPELKELMDNSGLGNHPEFIRLFHKLAPALREDRGSAPTGLPAGKKPDRLERLYGDMK